MQNFSIGFGDAMSAKQVKSNDQSMKNFQMESKKEINDQCEKKIIVLIN